MRLWRPGGPSKIELALELLSYARNHLHCRPEYVLFDAWYPSRRLLKRLRDYGWYFAASRRTAASMVTGSVTIAGIPIGLRPVG